MGFSIFGIFYLIFKPNETHKPKYKVNDYFEYWDNGDEFTPKKLLKLGKIEKVGKEYYLIQYFYCDYLKKLYTSTERIEYLDKYYKSVTFEQFSKDGLENCIKNE